MPGVYVLIVLLAALFACQDDAQPASGGEEAPSPTSTDEGEVKEEAPKEGRGAPFTVEVDQHGLFDAELHSVKLDKRFEDEAPGPRWIAHGRARNDSEQWIYRGDLFGELTVCFKDALKEDGSEQEQPSGFDREGCLRQESFQPGFELPISGSAPWRPGTWRHFTVVAGPLNPVFREMSPDQVRAGLKINVRGALGHLWEEKLWEAQPDWVQLRGYPIMKPFTLTSSARVANWPLERGDRVFVEGLAGRRIALRYKGRRYWVEQQELPPLEELEGERAEPTKLPMRVERESLILEILEFSRTHLRREAEGKRDVRYLVVDVAVTGLDERSVRLSRTDFKIVMGDQETAEPLPVNNITPNPMSFEALSLNERQTGKLAFEWPYGVAPMALIVTLPEEAVTVIPPRELR